MITSAKVVADGVSYEDYSRQTVQRGDPAFSMSRGELVAFALNPEKYLASTPDDDDTPATLFGRLVETLEMAPETFEKLFAIHPENYPCEPTKRDPREEKPWTTRADYCKEWEEEAEQAGLTPISPKLKAEADIAVKAAQAYGPRAELVACSKKQVFVSGEWEDKATGLVIPIRCLIDLVPDVKHPTMGKWLADSKTARNGDPSNFARVCDESSYDCQAALSIDLYSKATGEDRCEWVLPLSENTPPFHIVKPMPALTHEFLEYGRAKVHRALARYAQCLATNEWPSYSTGDRLVFNGVQYIAPDSLFSYRQSGGAP